MKMLKPNSFSKQQRGFSLLEIALALAIFAFLAYGLASIIKVDNDYEDYRSNKETMQLIKSSLMAYVQSNNFLLCPDVNGDGIEDRNGDRTCSQVWGGLPYLDLGVAERDAWGNPFYYAVNPNTANVANLTDNTDSASYFNNNVALSGEPFFNLNTDPFSNDAYTGALFVCGENAPICGAATPNQDLIETAALLVVVSFGKNGTLSWSRLPLANNITIGEEENLDTDNYFLRTIGSNNLVSGFDDELIWINGFDVKFAIVRSRDSLSD